MSGVLVRVSSKDWSTPNPFVDPQISDPNLRAKLVASMITSRPTDTTPPTLADHRGGANSEILDETQHSWNPNLRYRFDPFEVE